MLPQITPLGVQATRTKRNLGIDFASGKRVEVQRTCQADEENPRQIVGAMAAAGAECASPASINPKNKQNKPLRVAVTGLNETQLQSRSQMASCLVKRMYGKSTAMVLMMAGDELDPVYPVFDSLAPVIPHACAVGRLDALEQRKNAWPRSERSVRCGCCDPQTHAVDDPRA